MMPTSTVRALKLVVKVNAISGVALADPRLDPVLVLIDVSCDDAEAGQQQRGRNGADGVLRAALASMAEAASGLVAADAGVRREGPWRRVHGVDRSIAHALLERMVA